MFFRSIRRWWLDKTTKIVVMTTVSWKDGDVQEYAIRKPSLQFFMFRYEYLDLSVLKDNNVTWNKNQGSMYGTATFHKTEPAKLLWWDKPETILKYCTSPELDLVVNARKALLDYVQPKPKKLPRATAIVDVDFELAQFKLRGGYKEK